MLVNSLFKSKVVRNAGWIIICKVAQSILSVIVTMISARYLGPSNYGLINYAASIVAFVSPIALLGFGSVTIQELVTNKDDEGKIMGSTIISSLLSAFVCVVGVFCFSIVVNHGDADTVIVCTLYSVMLLFQATELITLWFQSQFLSKYSSIVSFIAYALVAAYKLFLLIKGLSVYLFAISNAIDYMLISVSLIIIYKKAGGKKLSFDLGIAKRLLSKSKHYIIPNIMIAIFTQTDHIMIKHMINDAATGYYSAALSCANFLNFVYTAMVDSARPAILEKYNIDKDQFVDNLKKLFSIIIYMTIIAGGMLCIFAEIVIKILYGDTYLEAVPVLRIICWFSLFSYLGSVRNIWVLAQNKQKYLWLMNLSGALVNVILNFVLIPIFGIEGAAVASLVAQISCNIIAPYIFKPYRYCTYIMIQGINPLILLKLIITPKRKRNR